MDARRTTSLLFAACVTTSLFLVGCSEDAPGPTPEPRPGTQVESRGVDTRSFYDGYEEAMDGDLAYSANGSGAMPTSPQGSAALEDRGGGPPTLPDPDDDNTFVDAGVSGFVIAAEDA
ncbi:hypothetical protein, partial [Nocardioides sp.]|uniref:hypothetical protein n=1 Tax=Nocardioides sp. TaxID=35761 RepID=UPI00286D52BB